MRRGCRWRTSPEAPGQRGLYEGWGAKVLDRGVGFVVGEVASGGVGRLRHVAGVHGEGFTRGGGTKILTVGWGSWLEKWRQAMLAALDMLLGLIGS